MITKYILFRKGFKHPVTKQDIGDHVIRVQAKTDELIRMTARARFGTHYERIVPYWDEQRYFNGIYETLIYDEDDKQVHCFKGEHTHELIKQKQYSFEEETAQIAQHYKTPTIKQEDDDKNKKNKRPAGERTGGTEVPAPRSKSKTSGSSDKKGSSDETSKGYDYLS